MIFNYKATMLLSAIDFYMAVHKTGQIKDKEDKQDFLDITNWMRKSGYCLDPYALKMEREFEEQLS